MVSADLWERKDPEPNASTIIDLIYEFDGTIAWVFHVSSAFAEKHGITGVRETLPEHPGEWVHELQCCCKKCFEEVQNGFFDDNFKWVSNA
jgi:hypothetical protein